MLSSKQILETGSSLRATFVGHKVNRGEAGPGPGPGTPLSSLWPPPDVRMVHRDFLLLPAPECPLATGDPGEKISDQGHSLTRPAHHREPVHAAPSPGRQSLNAIKTLRTFVSKSINQSFLQDGRQEPRGGRLDRRLPNPRAMSKKNHPDENKPDTRYTHMVMQFGQFLDHDLTLTPKDGKLWNSEHNHLLEAYPFSRTPVTFGSYFWCKYHRANIGEFLNS